MVVSRLVCYVVYLVSLPPYRIALSLLCLGTPALSCLSDSVGIDQLTYVSLDLNA